MTEYNDGLRHGSRRPRLYLTKKSEAVKFEGESIEGYCVITASKYQQNGKWSNTTYQLELAPGVKAFELLSPLHGTWGDNFTSWGEVVEYFSLPIQKVKEIVEREYPSLSKRMDSVEKFALELESQGQEMETVVISFGSPTNRAIREGYWSDPKTGQTSDGQKVIIEPSQGEYGSGWCKPVVVTPRGARVISSKHSPGMHGGYWAIEVVVPVKLS